MDIGDIESGIVWLRKVVDRKKQMEEAGRKMMMTKFPSVNAIQTAKYLIDQTQFIREEKHDLVTNEDKEKVLCGNVIGRVRRIGRDAGRIGIDFSRRVIAVSSQLARLAHYYMSKVDTTFEFRQISPTVDMTNDYVIACYSEDPIKSPMISDGTPPRMTLHFDPKDMRFSVTLSTQKQAHLNKMQRHIIHSHFNKEEAKDLE